MKIIYQTEFKIQGVNEIVICYYIFGYYLVDVWLHTEETSENAPDRINYIQTRYLSTAEEKYYQKISDLIKRMEETEDVC